MKCVIPGANVRVLAKAIHALARIGDEMYIEPQSSSVSFRTVNMANSAYADFTFYQSYFSYYVYGDLQENDALKCKISMRSAMMVFKTPNLIDKQVETCHIRLEPDASEILFILKYKNSIIKTHLLPILDCEILQTAYDKDCATNQFSSQPRVLGDAMQNFHQNLIEITLEASSQKLLLRNYIDDTSESVMIPVGIYFEQAGKPVIFGLKNPSFDGNLVLSTLSSGTDSQTDSTISGRQEKSVKRRAGNRRASRRSNKSATNIENKTAKKNKTAASVSAKDIHPRLVEQKKQTNEHTTKEKESSQLNRSNRTTKNNEGNDHISYLPVEEHSQKQSHSRSVEQNNQKIFHNNPSTSYNTSALSKPTTSARELVSSAFSTITKRKSVNNETGRQERENQDKADISDTVPNSPTPPAKKARLIFQKCFQKTFDPRTLPGYDIILAEDSDESGRE
ncbi:cell cycle checkpoint control protein Rad9 isoform X2 [Halictus rubicundus]|uniref:cell cycle checkpoint control protein Rad9 isoform X2 n=1 Tax=Halictus rubicundus TaxID=77578 RepID=UPI0040367D1B